MPDYVFEDLPGQELQEFDDKFLIEFQEKFGKENSVFNVHYVHHAPENRQRGDLTKVSTYGPESKYGQLGRDIKVGTRSETLQALRNTYMKILLKKEDHMNQKKCKQHLTFSTTTTQKRDDTLISLSVNTFAKIVEIGTEELKVRKIETTPFDVDFSPRLTWSKIGVECFSKISDEITTIKRSKVFGKAVLCNGIISSVPRNILSEK